MKINFDPDGTRVQDYVNAKSVVRNTPARLRNGQWFRLVDGKEIPEAIAHTQTGTDLQEYRGFHFSYPGRVFRNGVQVFTSHLFDTFEEAQKMIDASLRQTELTNFEERQLNKYGNIAYEETEAADRMAEWVHEQAELQLMERESN